MKEWTDFSPQVKMGGCSIHEEEHNGKLLVISQTPYSKQPNPLFQGTFYGLLVTCPDADPIIGQYRFDDSTSMMAWRRGPKTKEGDICLPLNLVPSKDNGELRSAVFSERPLVGYYWWPFYTRKVPMRIDEDSEETVEKPVVGWDGYVSRDRAGAILMEQLDLVNSYRRHEVYEWSIYPGGSEQDCSTVLYEADRRYFGYRSVEWYDMMHDIARAFGKYPEGYDGSLPPGRVEPVFYRQESLFPEDRDGE